MDSLVSTLVPKIQVITSTDVEDSLENTAITVNTIAARRHNSSASIRVVPTGIRLQVWAVSTMDPTIYNQDPIVLVNPVDNSTVGTIHVKNAGNQSTGVFLAGSFAVPSNLVGKVLEIREGVQALISGTVKGTFVYGVAGCLRAGPEVTDRRLAIYGDSIACGYTATTPLTDGWSMLVRNGYPGRVALEAWGSRTLSADQTAGLSALATRLVGLLKRASRRDLVLFIGTNDYGLSTINAATFQTHYATLLDDIHALDAGLNLYCCTPLLRSVETANGVGSTMPNYRTAISTVCSTRVWSTFVNTFAWVTGGQLDPDGAHIQNPGHAAVAAQMQTLLGY